MSSSIKRLSGVDLVKTYDEIISRFNANPKSLQKQIKGKQEKKTMSKNAILKRALSSTTKIWHSVRINGL
jgi:hypothetical protein